MIATPKKGSTIIFPALGQAHYKSVQQQSGGTMLARRIIVSRSLPINITVKVMLIHLLPHCFSILGPRQPDPQIKALHKGLYWTIHYKTRSSGVTQALDTVRVVQEKWWVSYLPLWLGHDGVHHGSGGRVGQTLTTLVKHPAVDPLLHHHHRKLGTETNS